MADYENGDEVKVFRRGEDADDDTIGESSEQQLADDKKEAVLEAELEAGRVPPIIGAKAGSFNEPKASPAFPNFMPGLMNASLSPFFPYLPIMMPTPYALRPAASPNFWHPAAMSPTFMLPMQAMSPTQNPLYNMMMAAAAKQHLENQGPLAAGMQNAGMPLNPVNQLRMHPYMNPGSSGEKKNMVKVKKEDHIKKPLNAFMWFMKVNRKKLLDETGNNEKQSAELNKELGKMWHGLSKEDQQVYFDMAKKDREDHKQKYPEWSARENYAVNKKTKKKRRDKTIPTENSDQKKCRARFGVGNQEMWCKFCKRKKKCEYSSERSSSNEGMSVDLQDRGSLGPSPMASSIGRSPMGANASDSESDVEDEDVDPTISQQAREVIMQESLCTI